MNWFCPINDLGYGVHSRNLLKAWLRRGNQAALYPIDWSAADPEPELLGIRDSRPGAPVDGPSLILFHEQYLDRFPGKPRIGFPVFELPTLKDDALRPIRAMDVVLVATKWAQEVLSLYGIDSHVVNEGFDPDIFVPHGAKKTRPGPLFVMVGKCEARKSTLETIRAWEVATRGTQSSLVAHVHNPFLAPGITNKVIAEGLSGSPHPFSVSRYSTESCFSDGRREVYVPPLGVPLAVLVDIYRAADFGLFCSRAEGWNLPLVECAACETPAVATTWTAHSEYVRAPWPAELMVADYEQEVADDGIWFRGDRGDWFTPVQSSIEAAIHRCLEAWNTPKQFEWGKDCRTAVQHLTWSNAAHQLEMLSRKQIWL